MKAVNSPRSLLIAAKLAALAACLLLAACCDLRLSVDSPTDPHAYQPIAVGNAPFVFEVYGYPNFDLAHADLGQRFISMRDGQLEPVGANYARSVILNARTGTILKVTTDDGHIGTGAVGQDRELKVKDLCHDNADGTYKIDGHMSCDVTSVQIMLPEGP
jgi:hypothetical protein